MFQLIYAKAHVMSFFLSANDLRPMIMRVSGFFLLFLLDTEPGSRLNTNIQCVREHALFYDPTRRLDVDYLTYR